VEPIDLGQPILARCWPRGSTSDSVPPIRIQRAYPLGFGPDGLAVGVYAMDAGERVVVTSSLMEQGSPSALEFVRSLSVAEELGDLKLYRVPDRTTVASRQSKQVRLMDRAAVPMTRIYAAEFWANEETDYEPMIILLRTRNDHSR
jgi:hypothetical protein